MRLPSDLTGVSSLALLRVFTVCACGAPLLILGWYIAGELERPGSVLGADPGVAVVRYLGEWSITWLLTTLTLGTLARCTWPRCLNWRLLTRVRRMVGLFAFSYVGLHLLAYLGLLAGFELMRVVDDLTQRPYIMVGFAGFLALLPLAVTSTRGWQRRLGSRWKRLHRLVYLVCVLAVLHLLWLSKSSYADAFIYGSWAAVLLVERLLRVRRGRLAGLKTSL
jgi:sulfoxide reductase heme-binding subunit YedZ